MRRIMRKFALAVMVALAGTFVASCDSAERLAAPESELAPQYGTNGVARGSQSSRYTILQPLPDADIEGSISYEVEVGGSGRFLALKDGSESYVYLYIQPGTVRKNTRFDITVTRAPYLLVDLQATSRGSKVQNDVGQNGFKKDVYLYINTVALELPAGLTTCDANRLAIGQLVGNENVIPTASGCHGSWLWGALPHFSSWVPIAN